METAEYYCPKCDLNLSKSDVLGTRSKIHSGCGASVEILNQPEEEVKYFFLHERDGESRWIECDKKQFDSKPTFIAGNRIREWKTETQPSSKEVEESKWDKLNREFDEVLESMTPEHWKKIQDKWNQKHPASFSKEETAKDWEREAEAEELYPVKFEQYSTGIPHGMYGMCDSNHYERKAFLEGIKACQMHSTQGLDELID